MMVKKIWIVLVVLLNFCDVQANTVKVQNSEDHRRPLKLAIDSDLAPFSFIDQPGQSRGMLVDYWKLWAKKVSRDIEFVPLTLQQSLIALKDNQVDMHVSLFNLQKIQSNIEYLSSNYPTKSHLYIRLADRARIKSIADLKGKKIGVVVTSLYQQYVAKKLPYLTIKQYSKFSELTEAIDSNDIDAFIGEAVTTQFQLVKTLSFSQYIRLDSFELNNMISAAVVSDKLELQKLVRSGLAEITDRELLELEKKWIANEQLRYLSQRRQDVSLNEQERLWIRSHRAVQFGSVENSWPASIQDKGINKTSFDIELLKLINKNLNVNFSIKPYALQSEATTDVKNSTLDGILSLPSAGECDNDFDCSASYFYLNYDLIVRADNDTIHNPQDLSRKRVAMLTHDQITIKLNEEVENTEIVYANNEHQAFQMLVNKTVEAILLAHPNRNALTDSALKISGLVLGQRGEFTIATTKFNPILGSIIDKGINSITPQQMEGLLTNSLSSHDANPLFTKRELLYIAQHPILTVGVPNWTPVIYRNSEGISGFVGDFLRQVSEISGLKLKVISNSWPNLLRDFKQQKIDLLPATFYSEQRSEFGLFGEGYLNLKSSIYLREQNTSINNFSDLSGLKLGLIQDNPNYEAVKNLFPQIEIVEAANASELMSKLLDGEVDAIFHIDANMSYILKNDLIQGIKSLPQTEIPPTAIHFFSNYNEPLLHSILTKSLNSIGQSRKRIIVDNWLGITKLKKALNIAFVAGSEPYTIAKQRVKGIEYDLIARIFEPAAVRVSKVIYLQNAGLQQALNEYSDIDAVVTVEYQPDGYFYSDDFITFENVVVSRQADALQINNVSDLKDKRIMAFHDAYKYLGDKFRALFHPDSRPTSYSEVIFQHQQVSALLAGVVEVIVLDKNIFKWFIHQAGYKDFEQFKLDFIFKDKNTSRIAFRDESLRDVFNHNLRRIKNSGEYQHIIDDYSDGHVVDKVELTSLISSLVSRPIYHENQKQLIAIVDLIGTLPYLNKIEVFNNDQVLLHSTSTRRFKFYSQHDCYEVIFNTASKVGHVKVYFDEAEVAKQLARASLIPDIQLFKLNDQYQHFRDLYRRFGYLNKKIEFTALELTYLKSHPVISYSAINWQPLAQIKNNEFSGLIADYMRIITERTGVEFSLQLRDSWADVINSFIAQEIDMLPSVPKLFKELNLGITTDQYASFNYAIIMDNSASFADSIADLNGKSLAIPTGSTLREHVKQNYPDIRIVDTKNLQQALTLVREHKVDAYIDHRAVATYQLEHHFTDLKIAGLIDFEYQHFILLQGEHQLLVSIINKVFAAITPQQHQEIAERWIKQQLVTPVNYLLIYQLIAIFAFILIIVLMVFKKFTRARVQIEQANSKLNQTVAALEEQKHVFERLFYDTTDGLLLMHHSLFIDCNNAALRMLGFSSGSQLINTSVSEISPKLQPDGTDSMQRCQAIQAQCKKDGQSQFEWVHIDAAGNTFWVDIVLTAIKLNHQEIVHVVWRDISEKKRLEQQILARNDQLERTNQELEHSFSNLKKAQQQLVKSEKMASLGGLVAGVAHELNTPVGIGLTAITHFADMTEQLMIKYRAKKMSKQDFDKYINSSVESVRIINRNLERTAGLVRSFKQISVDQSSDERRAFNINDYIEENLLSISHIIKKTNAEIIVRCDKDLVIDSYPGAFSQIISNLLINSTIHGFPNNEPGVITIIVENTGNSIKLIYKDDGRGIPGDNLPKIFDPFFTTNREHGGSGLGLNIIYNIVTSRLNGNIECNSELGVGTEFIIEFETEMAS